MPRRHAPWTHRFSPAAGWRTIILSAPFDVAAKELEEMPIVIRTDPPVSPHAVKALWDLVPWSRGRDPESVMRAIQGSELVVTAWDEERLVGTCRVITDGVYYATLWDVIVHPDYRGQGIGTRLVEAALEPFRHRGFSYIALYSVQGVEPFYERLGFKRHPAGMRLEEPPVGIAAPPPPETSG